MQMNTQIPQYIAVPNLEIVREEMGLSQRDLGMYINLPEELIASIERGEKKMPRSAAKRLINLVAAHRKNGREAFWEAVL